MFASIISSSGNHYLGVRTYPRKKTFQELRRKEEKDGRGVKQREKLRQQVLQKKQMIVNSESSVDLIIEQGQNSGKFPKVKFGSADQTDNVEPLSEIVTEQPHSHKVVNASVDQWPVEEIEQVVQEQPSSQKQSNSGQFIEIGGNTFEKLCICLGIFQGKERSIQNV